ncbi:MAG TPA: peptidylprolyl isomerase [Gaiellaceae bacterium]|jgi:parvulin-like peptidyl-prolyl isomerase
MKLRYFLSVGLLALLLAGCGGGGAASLSAGDIAVVGKDHITKVSFQQVMNEQLLSLKAQGQTAPKAGTTAYESLKGQVIGVLVQNAEFDAQASKLGVTVTEKSIDAQLAAIKKQYFGSSETKYKQGLKAQGYTVASLREQIREELLSQDLFNKVTANVTPSDKEVQAYYQAHKSSYAPTRAVDEILVGKNKQSLAESIYNQIKGGADFGKLAKKYSQDPGSKNQGGSFTANKGQDVPEFDAAVFNAKNKTGQLLAPVDTAQYGWFVIKLVGDIKPTSEAAVAPTIKSQLEQQDRNQQMTDWVSNLTKSYCSGGKVKYEPGYQPSPDPCQSLSTATNTTTTG